MMRTFVKESIVFLLSIGCFAIPANAAGGFNREGLFVYGEVLSPEGNGLPGVTVMLTTVGSQEKKEYVTGEHGIFRTGDLAAGSWEITAYLEGYGLSPALAVELTAAPAGPLRLVLAPLAFSEYVEVIATCHRREEMTGGEIRQSGARDTGEALQHLSGVHSIRKGGIATDVAIRGYQGENLNILIDGVRIQGACPNNMDPGTFHVDLAEVERVEVASGPFDIKNYGSLGGVVQIVTKKPAGGLHFSSGLAVGTAGYVNPTALVTYGSDRFSASGGFSFRRSDPYRDGAGRRFTELANYRAAVLDSDAFRVATGWAGLSVAPATGHRIWINVARQEADHVLYPYLQMDAPYDDTDRVQFGYEATRLTGPVASVRVRGYFSRVRHWMTDELRQSSEMASRSYSMATKAETNYAGAAAEIEWHRFTLGGEFTRRNWNTSTVMAGSKYVPQYSIPDVVTGQAGVYLSREIPLLERVVLQAGGRLDYTRAGADRALAGMSLYKAYHRIEDTGMEAWCPSGYGRLVFQPSKAVTVRAGLGSTVRAPDAQELYFALRRMGTDWVGNPALRPARNTGVATEIDLAWKSISGQVKLYYDRVHNYFTIYEQPRRQMVPGVMNTKARSYANAEARLYGGEFEMSSVIGSRFFVSGGLSLVYGSKEARPELNIHGGPLAEIPPVTGRLTWRYDDGTFFGAAEGVFAAAQTRVDRQLQEQPTAGYGVVNLRGGLNWRWFQFGVSLNNLLDRFYINHLSYQRDPFRSGVRVPEPGRSLTASLAVKF